MRVLCAGDLHIGRRPSRLPTHVDARPLSCADAWTRIVDHALDARADLVALGGDLVDRANRYFEALGPLERGVRRLADAGIVTVAVAGNHDHDVLPQLARALAPTLPAGAFRLLGAGGTWERTTIERDGARLHVDGWSFPAEHVDDDPMVIQLIFIMQDGTRVEIDGRLEDEDGYPDEQTRFRVLALL